MCSIEEFRRTAAGCDRAAHYRWLRDEEYRKSFERARDEVNGLLEDEGYGALTTGR